MTIHVIVGTRCRGRQYTAPPSSGGTEGGYRYGFNGKEKSDEIAFGVMSFEARIYDSRIGRFFSTDPRESEYAWQSTYVYFSNCPTSVLDVLGMGGGEGGGEGGIVPLPAPSLGLFRTWKYGSAGSGTQRGYYKGLWINSRKSEGTANTLMHVIDDKGVAYWILSESHFVMAHLSNGQNKMVLDHSFYYFTITPGPVSTYKGGEFKPFEIRDQTEVSLTNQLNNGIAFGLTGLLAGGAMVLSSPVAGGVTLGTRVNGVILDYVTQVAANRTTGKNWKQSLGDVNATSLYMSFLNPATSLKGVALNQTIGNFSSFSIANGYNGVGVGKSIGTATFQIIVGTAFGGLPLPNNLKLDKLNLRLNHVKGLSLAASTKENLQNFLKKQILQTQMIKFGTESVGGTAGETINNKLDDLEQK